MWKAYGKTTTLLLFLDSLFPKIEEMCEMHKLEIKHSGAKLPHLDVSGGGGVSRGNIMQY
jgi:hypothetical protein